MSEEMTLAIDCGGGGIKAFILDSYGTMIAPPLCISTPYPLPPVLLIQTVVDLVAWLPYVDRVAMGIPGMIRHGIVAAIPHYTTQLGPRSRIPPGLAEEWRFFDMGYALGRALDLPTEILNDAEVAGTGVVIGTGLEMIITLGVGLGNTVFDEGVLTPYIKVSQGFVHQGLIYNDYIGEYERLRLGDTY